jgi:hypothetical protein
MTTKGIAMIRKLGWMGLLLLAGCAGAPTGGNSACDPGHYQCQVDMYSKAGG